MVYRLQGLNDDLPPIIPCVYIYVAGSCPDF